MKLHSENNDVENGCHWQLACLCETELAGNTARQAGSATRCRLVLCLLFVVAGCGESVSELTAIRGETMGTTYSVKISPSPDETAFEELQQKIDSRLEEINNAMSTWRADSELSRFNQFDKTDWFPVSKDTVYVVKEALKVARLSEGAFDPTVSPLVNLWSFGNDETKRQLPNEHNIQDALKHVGYKKIEVQIDPPALKKNDVQTTLDLSAIAKGFGVDEICELLKSEGYEHFLVEIGGEVRTSGSKAEGQAWKIGILSPQTPASKVQSKISLSSKAMATSGDYRNYFEIDGKRYSHTINPKTGKPVEHNLASVSVIADDCMTADALATTLMVSGTEQGRKLAEEMKVAAFFLERDGDDLKEVQSAGFAEFLEKSAPANWTRVFLVTLVVFLAVVLMMAVGVILGKIRIKGSCGGLAGIKDAAGNPMCESCTTPAEECSRFQQGNLDAEEIHHDN